MGWEDKTAEALWGGQVDISWNAGGWWDITGGGSPSGWMFDAGTWTDDYRPTLMRVTFTGGSETVYIKLEDASDNTIGIDTSCASLDEIELSFTGAGASYDIDQIVFDDLGGEDVTKIEFYIEEDVGWDAGEIMGVDAAADELDEFLTVPGENIDELLTVPK